MMKDTATLYKYVTADHLDEIIEKNRLLLSDGSNFNDPFELNVFQPESKNYRKINNLLILCLTTSYKNFLMWSHYADSHKGACLTLEVPRIYLRAVCDTNTQPTSKTNVTTLLKNSKIKVKKGVCKEYDTFSNDKKFAYIKSKAWKYEKEYRIVFDKDEDGLIREGDQTYMSVKINNIYLGVRNDMNKNKLIELCNKYNITVKQMILGNGSFNLQLQK